MGDALGRLLAFAGMDKIKVRDRERSNRSIDRPFDRVD